MYDADIGHMNSHSNSNTMRRDYYRGSQDSLAIRGKLSFILLSMRIIIQIESHRIIHYQLSDHGYDIRSIVLKQTKNGFFCLNI